jgi:hypothetical protein
VFQGRKHGQDGLAVAVIVPSSAQDALTILTQHLKAGFTHAQ